MPGSADISGLNLQFGALQFGSEPVLQEYESTPATTTPGNQVQNSLYTSPSRLVTFKIKHYKLALKKIILSLVVLNMWCLVPPCVSNMKDLKKYFFNCIFFYFLRTE